MLNLAGRMFDFGPVVYAVLDECEHCRRGLTADEAPAALRTIATEKLAQIRAAYDERSGSALYWRALEREVLQNVLPQYASRAIEMTRLEANGYDVWRGGDLVARAVFALAALTVGGIVIAVPFIPIVEDTFAFALALAAWFYPELRRATVSFRHARLLNRLIQEAARYQGAQLRYLTDDALEAELEEAQRGTFAGGQASGTGRRALPT